MPLSQPDVIPSEALDLRTAQPGERAQDDARQKLIGCSGEKLMHFAGCEDLDGILIRFDGLRGFDGVIDGKPTGHRKLEQNMQCSPVVAVATVRKPQAIQPVLNLRRGDVAYVFRKVSGKTAQAKS